MGRRVFVFPSVAAHPNQLHRRVLVLNRAWIAVHACSVRRALTLVFQDLARIVADDFQTHDFHSWRELSQYAAGADPLIHTPNFQILVPEVIVLSHYNRMPPRTVRFNRRNIFVRDHHTCQYCGKKPPKDELTIDHVIPTSRGGGSTWENVVLACTRCNVKKGNHLPSECGMHPAVKPVKPQWLAQFVPPKPCENSSKSLWEKFVDIAYWETQLEE